MIPHGEATRLYAAYLNAPREFFSHDEEEQKMFDQDTAKARAEMERSYLEEKPVVGS